MSWQTPQQGDYRIDPQSSMQAPQAPPPPQLPQPSRFPALFAGGADRRPLLFGGAMFAVGLLLASVALLVPHYGVRSTVRRLHELLVAGDLPTLRSQQALGAKRWANAVVSEAGQQEYNRVLAIYQRAEELGGTEYERLRVALLNGGQSAYNNLGYDDRRVVDRRSHDEWVWPQGYSLVPEAATAGTLAEILQTPLDPDVVEGLGAAALSEAQRTLIADRADTDPTVQADPALVRIAATRTTRGTAALRRLRDRMATAGERAFRRLSYGSREEINGRSHALFLMQQGMASLSAQDRSRVGDAGVFDDPARSVALRERLGLEQLPLDERRQIAGHSRADFIAQREVFVEREGLRLGRELVARRYRESRYEIHDVRVSGHGSRDLVRRDHAHARLRWTRTGEGTLQTLRSVVMRWDGDDGRWEVASLEWRSETRDGETSPPGSAASESEEAGR